MSQNRHSLYYSLGIDVKWHPTNPEHDNKLHPPQILDATYLLSTQFHKHLSLTPLQNPNQIMTHQNWAELSKTEQHRTELNELIGTERN